MKKCSVEGCENKYHAKGFCGTHYRKNKTHGNPLYVYKIEYCLVGGCNKKHLAKGYCYKHYRIFKTHGDPLYKFVKSKCIIKDCGKPHKAKGYCKVHYDKSRQSGHPLYNTNFKNSIETRMLKLAAREKAREYFKGKKFFCIIKDCKADNIILHHENYNMPLVIIPFCRKHHNNRHKQLRKMESGL